MEQHMDQYDQSYLKWKLDILNRYSRMWAMEKEHQYIDQLFILFLETIIYSHSYWYDRTEPLKSEVTAHNRRGRLLQQESASFGFLWPPPVPGEAHTLDINKIKHIYIRPGSQSIYHVGEMYINKITLEQKHFLPSQMQVSDSSCSWPRKRIPLQHCPPGVTGIYPK